VEDFSALFVDDNGALRANDADAFNEELHWDTGM